MQTRGYVFTDPTDIRFVILLTLSVSSKPLTDSEITEIILNNASINFFDLEEQLAALVSMGEITKQITADGQTVFELSENGMNTIAFFYKKVPFSVREKIKQSVVSLLEKEQLKRQVTAQIVPVNFDEYSISCSLNDAGVELLSFTMYAGSKETAQKMVTHFTKHSDSVYTCLFQSFLESLKD